MDRVNLFNPFVSKTDQHEDRATRAIAVTLRYSPLATFTLRSYLCELLQQLLAEQHPKAQEVPAEANMLDMLDSLHSTTCIATVATQVGSLPAKGVEKILSCGLIDDLGRDEPPFKQIGSEPRNGDARYDLVLHFPDQGLAIIFETKKFVGRPEPHQLRPTESDLRDSKIFPQAVLVSCRQLLSRFLALKSSGQAGQAEASVIQDLIDYFTEYHADLSPVLPLSQLSYRNSDVIMLRLARAMDGLLDPEKDAGFGYYRGNQNAYYIEPGFGALKRINLDLLGNEDSLKIRLAAHFGDTQSQATAFFQSDFSSGRLTQLLADESWSVEPNFHIHYVGTHLIWYETAPERLDDYLAYWKCPNGPGWEKLRQTKKEDLKALLRELEDRGLIVREEREHDEENQFWSTARDKFNIAPGLSIMKTVPFSRLSKHDKGMNALQLTQYFADVVRDIIDAAGISAEEVNSSKLNRALFMRE